jgi:hypothetical protein
VAKIWAVQKADVPETVVVAQKAANGGKAEKRVRRREMHFRFAAVVNVCGDLDRFGKLSQGSHCRTVAVRE